MKYASIAFVLGFLASGLASTPVLAATTSASFGVSVMVLASCQVSAPAAAFGTNTTAGGNAASTVAVACTNPVPYNIDSGAGLTSGTARKITGPASALPGGALLPDSTHTVNWSRKAGMEAVARSGNGSSQLHGLYGQSAEGRQLAPGANADSVTVTVTY